MDLADIKVGMEVIVKGDFIKDDRDIFAGKRGVIKEITKFSGRNVFVVFEGLGKATFDNQELISPDFTPTARWNSDQSKEMDSSKRTESFLKEIEKVCKSFDRSIAHEDGHGAFIIEKFDDHNIRWLNGAYDHTTR